jgi:hypothetical protein
MNTRPEAAARTSSNQLAGEGPGLSSREGVGNTAPSGGTGLNPPRLERILQWQAEQDFLLFLIPRIQTAGTRTRA